MGKRNSKMGVGERKDVVLLIGGTGGIGAALLEYLSPRIKLQVIPTFNQTLPKNVSFSWIHYNALDFKTSKEIIEELSAHNNVVMIIDATGAFFASRLQKADVSDINHVIETNLTAPLILAKSAQEWMTEGGKIIFLSSIIGTLELVGSSIYAASKAGLERGVLALAPEFSQSGQGICAIRLGYMDYGMTYKIEDSRRNKLLDQLPENKFISIAELGDKILNIFDSSINEMNGKIFEVV